jgi:hypothetical protein
MIAIKMNKYCWIVVLSLLISACTSRQIKDLTVENEYDLFQDLAIAETGLDFPPSQEHLETCGRTNDIPCLNSFHSFREGKTKLLQMSRDESLELTLKWLKNSCMVEPPEDFQYVCIGALTALYFFPEKMHDMKIRQFVSRLPQSTRDNLFHRSVSLGLCWLENRSDETGWRSWMESNLSDTTIKTHAINRLQKPAPTSDPLLNFPYNN